MTLYFFNVLFDKYSETEVFWSKNSDNFPEKIFDKYKKVNKII